MRSLLKFTGVLLLVTGSAPAQAPRSTVLTEQAEITPHDPFYSYVGQSVAASGDTLIVGAATNLWLTSGFNEAAYVFVNAGGSWVQQAKFISSDQAPKDLFGWRVALEDDTAVVAAPTSAGGGAVYVFVRVGTDWTLQAKLLSEEPGGTFGWSLALSGDTLLVGQLGSSALGSRSSGSVRVLQRNGAAWSEVTKLEAPVPHPKDNFGYGVALSGDTAVVCANGSIPAWRSAYAFTGSGSTWALQAELKPTDLELDEDYGTTVAVSGDNALVGSTYNDYVRSFARSGTTWSQTASLIPHDTQASYVGSSLAMSGSLALLGAQLSFVGDAQCGAAYLFESTGTTWIERAKLAPSDGAGIDEFGVSVAFAGPLGFVGSHYHQLDSGAAYVFAIPQPTFTDLGQALGGALGPPQLSASGSLAAGSDVTLTLGNAWPSAAAPLVVGALAISAPFKGGVLVPQPDVLVPASTSAAGSASLTGQWPAGVPSGISFYLQWWIADPSAVMGLAASNALAATTP